jgi:hypothetical protein
MTEPVRPLEALIAALQPFLETGRRSIVSMPGRHDGCSAIGHFTLGDYRHLLNAWALLQAAAPPRVECPPPEIRGLVTHHTWSAWVGVGDLPDGTVVEARYCAHCQAEESRELRRQAAAPPAPTAEAVATPEPHGPVSERFMRHHYGASGVTVWPPERSDD